MRSRPEPQLSDPEFGESVSFTLRIGLKIIDGSIDARWTEGAGRGEAAAPSSANWSRADRCASRAPSFLPPPPPVISSAPLQRAWLIGTKNLPIARCPGTICKYVQEDIYKKCSSHKAMKFRKLIDSTNPSITLLNGWRLNPRQIPFNDHSLMLGLDSIYVCDILDLVKVIGKIN